MHRFHREARLCCGLALLLFASADWTSAQTQSVDCAAQDRDGNGSVEIADAAALIFEVPLLTECLGLSMTRARACRGFDDNDDGAIDFRDQGLLSRQYGLFRGCFGERLSRQPGCAAVDDDRDGRITAFDFAAIPRLVEDFDGCRGVDLSTLTCAAVDYDGDARISSQDQALLTSQLHAFGGCLGTRLASPDGLWISRSRLLALATTGPAWSRIYAEAMRPFRSPDLSDQDDAADTRTLAKALVGVRLARADLLEDVRGALREVALGGSERGARTLSLARSLVAYVLAADIVDLAGIDPALDADFRRTLERLRTERFQGRSLVSTHEDRPNNWGTHAGASRVAIALYLGDEDDLAAAAAVHRGWLGERSAYAGFDFGSLSWQADPSRPVGINPRGASRGGIDLDGALPEEMRRGGGLRSPPSYTGYVWEALQGATVTTQLLARNGYPDAWSWGDHGIARAVEFLARLDAGDGRWWASGDDRWSVWLVNAGSGRAFPVEAGVSPGKNIGFTDWTHADW